MSREQRKITEHELHAYVDGALDGRARAAVEAYLAENPAVAGEVEAWRHQNETLRALYGHMAAEPMPPRLGVYRIERERRAAAGRWGRAVAAAVILVAISGTAGWYGRDILAPSISTRADLAATAMEAHRIYASEVIHPVEVWADEKDHLQTWLSKRLDRSINVPDLRDDGLNLVGGRLLPSARGPAAQFMYEDEAGHRVTLYIITAEEGRETAFRYVSLDRLEAFFWTDEGISCALVGDLSRDRLREIATQAYEQLG
ncbi:anti-sigma factor family protein [Chelativorans alearense]|uniref:anti-sigma factor family protein n=1 Tax=Chelativorans alearense TaxID=2681495 RepID=UPI0013D06B40|nr:anti-sigma factor [Chelativorans alearense]